MITDPTLTTPIARILALTEETELYNCPLGGGGTNVRVSGKPESRAPGHQAAPGLVSDVAAVLERTVRDIKALNDDAKLRDRTDAPHESIGGVSVDVGEVGGAYRRPVRIDVDGAMRHLRKVTFVSNLPKERGDIPA